jgi:hypothetical protein
LLLHPSPLLAQLSGDVNANEKQTASIFNKLTLPSLMVFLMTAGEARKCWAVKNFHDKMKVFFGALEGIASAGLLRLTSISDLGLLTRAFLIVVI